MTNWKPYLLWFAQHHIEFRYSELKSLIKLWDIPCRFTEPAIDSVELKKPFCEILLPNDEYAKTLASRSISIRCVIELWTAEKNLNNFHLELRKYIDDHKDNEDFMKLFMPECSFKVIIETYNKHFTQKEKIEKIETLSYLPVQADANLKNPDVAWYYIEFYGLDPTNVHQQPDDILFGKWIADGQRSLVNDISLKTRKFIGNTSMDPTLSLLMANQALAKPGDLVYDPFVGSGSLLVAAAKFGGRSFKITIDDEFFDNFAIMKIAYVAGSDIDFLMLHGKTRPSRIKQKVREKDESVLANLKQYSSSGLYIDVVVSDFSRSIWHNSIVFDSIITDPPYGIREATGRIEFKTRKSASNEATTLTIPSTSVYNHSHLYGDLLNFSAKYLKMSGRLVCWLPIYKSDYSEKTIPRHTCLELIANSQQDLSTLTCRRLLTFEKIAEPEEDKNHLVYEDIDDFRLKFFASGEETRRARRVKRAELREIGRKEAIKRGKAVDENGKVINKQ